MITTKGCEGCKIIDKLIKEALGLYKKEVTYVIKDKDEVDKDFLKTWYVNDFPSTFLIENDEVIFNFSGTRPAAVISRYMNTHFS